MTRAAELSGVGVPERLWRCVAAARALLARLDGGAGGS
jgi:hypothetical protein